MRYQDLFEQHNVTLPISATPDNLRLAKDFVFEKWKERSKERGDFAPDDLSGSCKFTSMFAQKVFGGKLAGNEKHQYVILNGQIIDLNIDANDVVRFQNEYDADGFIGYKENKYGWSEWHGPPHEHDEIFFNNRDHRESMKSCRPRVNQWVQEFIKILNQKTGTE